MTAIPELVTGWLLEQGFGEVTRRRSASGGCINNGEYLVTSQGQSFFLKTNPSAPTAMFAREAEGLLALAAAPHAATERVPRTPDVFLVGADFLLLEDLQPGSPQAGFWERLGRELAVLHLHTNPEFGFQHDNYIGSTPQPNTWCADGFAFFAEHRLLFQARLARRRGLLPPDDLLAVKRLVGRLSHLVPEQPASLLHGDLWSGNVLSTAFGVPALIDPAVYYGWAEAELAMTALFGAFPERFYLAYSEMRPLEKGYRQRFGLYNLYHLLNHLNLFGSGYLADVQAILNRY